MNGLCKAIFLPMGYREGAQSVGPAWLRQWDLCRTVFFWEIHFRFTNLALAHPSERASSKA